MMTFASSTSRYEVVPPPAPKTAARPATLGACQVLLQLSMLLLPTAVRMNFWAAKFTSLVAFEQLNMPKEVGPCRSMMPRIPLAAQSSACSQVAGRSFPFSRMRGSVSRCGDMALSLRSLAECLQRSAQRIPAFLARPKPMRGPLEHFKPGSALGHTPRGEGRTTRAGMPRGQLNWLWPSASVQVDFVVVFRLPLEVLRGDSNGSHRL